MQSFDSTYPRELVDEAQSHSETVHEHNAFFPPTELYPVEQAAQCFAKQTHRFVESQADVDAVLELN